MQNESSNESNITKNLKTLEIGLPREIEIKIQILDKLITLFGEAKKTGEAELEKWVEKTRSEVLIKKFGQSEEVADQYINAALERR